MGTGGKNFSSKVPLESLTSIWLFTMQLLLAYDGSLLLSILIVKRFGPNFDGVLE